MKKNNLLKLMEKKGDIDYMVREGESKPPPPQKKKKK